MVDCWNRYFLVSCFSSVKEDWTSWSLRPLLPLIFYATWGSHFRTPDSGQGNRWFCILAFHWCCWIRRPGGQRLLVWGWTPWPWPISHNIAQYLKHCDICSVLAQSLNHHLLLPQLEVHAFWLLIRWEKAETVILPVFSLRLGHL